MSTRQDALAEPYSGRMVSALSNAVPPFPIARFSVEQYHRMIESGAFTENDRLELIEGWVVQQMAKGPGHEYAVGQGEDLLRARMPAGWHVRNQAPITLANSEPELDLAIVRGDRGAYRRRHPIPSEVALVVEVSDTTLDTDRVKGKTYGSAGSPSTGSSTWPIGASRCTRGRMRRASWGMPVARCSVPARRSRFASQAKISARWP